MAVLHLLLLSFTVLLTLLPPAAACDPGFWDDGNGNCGACSDVTVTQGTCTSCTSAEASGCTAVTCDQNKYDSNGNPTDGCESSYDCSAADYLKTGDVCTTCRDVGFGRTYCTTLTACGANTFDTDNNPENGCEEGCTALTTDGTCTACTSPALNDCTAVTCDATTSTRWRYDSNGE